MAAAATVAAVTTGAAGKRQVRDYSFAQIVCYSFSSFNSYIVTILR